MICAASTPALRAPPMATVATGIPGGICTTAYNASTPCSALPLSGTPITGFVVSDASTPGRCAAIPAPAMKTPAPSRSASVTICFVRSGLRCADATFISYATPASSSAAHACPMTSASESLPMMMQTHMAEILAGREFSFGIGRRRDSCSRHRQTAPHEPAQRAEVERLRQKRADPFVDRRRNLGRAIRADDDDGNLPQFRLQLARLQHVPSREDRHHQVEDDDVR